MYQLDQVMGPEVMRDESFRVSGSSKASLSSEGWALPSVWRASVEQRQQQRQRKEESSPSALVWAGPSHLFCHWTGVYSTQTFRLTLSHTARFPEPPACRRRIVGCHSFLNGGNQFCTAPRYLCVCVSSIYVSLYHLPSSLRPFSHPSSLFLSACFLRTLTTQPHQTHCGFFLSFTVLINLFAFTYSYSQSAFRFSFMILTAVLFPLELCETRFLLVIHPRQDISLQLQIPLKLKLLSPSPGLSIACCAGRCAKTLFSLWVCFDFLLSTLHLAHCEAVSSEYTETEWNLRKHSFSRS